MKKTLKIFLIFLSILSLVSCKQTDKWEQLFNGKDLSGWTVTGYPQDIEKNFWTVDNGTIYCNSMEKEHHTYVWLVTNREFRNFELRLKFQAYSESPGNSGIQIRSRFDPTAEDGGWMNGPQVDIHPPKPQTWRTGLIYDETDEVRHWIYPCLPGANMPNEYEPEEYIMKYAEDGDGWNELIIICKGMIIKTIVNGIVRINDWDATGVLDTEDHRKHNVGETGHIALQLHHRDRLKIRFKDIQIKEFK